MLQIPALRRFLMPMACCAALAAGDPPSEVSAGPRMPGLGSVAALIQVSQMRWILGQADEMAGAAGIDPTAMRQMFSQALLRIDDPSIIDDSRMSTVAVRDDRGVFSILVPIKQRGVAMEQLARGLDGSAPLIRTGDRDGTMVFSRSTDQGLVEYRGLASDRWFAVATTKGECQQMIAQAPTIADGAPLVIHIDPQRLGNAWSSLGFVPVRSRVPARLRLTPAMLAPLDGLVPWPDSSDWTQVRDIRLTVAAHQQAGTWDVRVRIRAVPESPFAAWLLAQRPAADRASPLLASSGAWLSYSTMFQWQDQFSRTALSAAQTLSDTEQQAMVTLMSGMDRSHALSGGAGWLNGTIPWRVSVIEHPSAKELMAANEVLEGASEITQSLTLGGETAVYRSRHVQIAGQTQVRDSLRVACADRLLHVVTNGSATAALPIIAGNLVTTAQNQREPAPACLARGEWRIDRWLAPFIANRRLSENALPVAAISGEVQLDRGDLVIVLRVPVLAACAVISALDLAPAPRVVDTPKK